MENVKIMTLSPTLHLLFLIMHAVNHMLFSGVGIRQLSDISVFCQKNRDRIDVAYVFGCLRTINWHIIGANIIKICEEYLGLEHGAITIPPDICSVYLDFMPLLEDVLDAGVFGSSNADRVHSVLVTRHEKSAHGLKFVLHSSFPKRKDIEKTFTYLQKAPFLLPVAWLQRAIRYLAHVIVGSASASRSIELGNERLQLLTRYGIVADRK